LEDTIFPESFSTNFWQFLNESNKIKFYECKIDTDKPLHLSDILRGSKTNSLEFMGCGILVYSDWVTKPQLLENIIKSLGTSEDMKKNLITFSLGSDSFNDSRLLSLLEDNGLLKCVNQIKMLEADKPS
jgi:hypothetical protein